MDAELLVRVTGPYVVVILTDLPLYLGSVTVTSNEFFLSFVWGGIVGVEVTVDPPIVTPGETPPPAVCERFPPLADGWTTDEVMVALADYSPA